MTDDFIQLGGKRYRRSRGGIVADGEGITVPMPFMDHRPMLTDGQGRAAGHRPGHVYSSDRAVQAQRGIADAVRETHLALLSGTRPGGLQGRDLYLDRLANPQVYTQESTR